MVIFHWLFTNKGGKLKTPSRYNCFFKMYALGSAESYFHGSNLVQISCEAFVKRNVFEKRKNQSQIMHKTSLSPCQTQCILLCSQALLAELKGFHFFTRFLPISYHFSFFFSAPQNAICIKTKKKKGKSSKIVLWKYDWEKDLSILSWLWSLHFFQPPSSSENQR